VLREYPGAPKGQACASGLFSPLGGRRRVKMRFICLLVGWWRESNSFEILVLSWDDRRQEMIPQGGWVK